VYVDDFIGMVQGSRCRRHHVKRILLHSLDKVFCKLEDMDDPRRQEPVLIKKMLKGDAAWETQKTALGWMIDTVRMTIELPPHRIERLFELLDTVDPGQKRISVQKWQKLVGELRSMVIAIPDGRGLFIILQEILAHNCDKDSRLRISPDVHDILGDFRWFAQDLQRRPTQIAEIIPASEPATLGAQNAAGMGMGGVHFVPLPDGSIQPLLWRSPFSSHIQLYLVSFSSPTGKITNSDLKLAANVTQHNMLVGPSHGYSGIHHPQRLRKCGQGMVAVQRRHIHNGSRRQAPRDPSASPTPLSLCSSL
jgi:hypothetical protein